MSGGNDDPPILEFYKNYVNFSFPTGRGVNVVKFDPNDASIIVDKRAFDTYGASNAGNDLVAFLNTFTNG